MNRGDGCGVSPTMAAGPGGTGRRVARHRAAWPTRADGRAAIAGYGRRWVPPILGGLILVLVLQRFGTEPVRRGLAATDAGVVAAAMALTGLATLAASWRWSILAAQAGRPIRFPDAVASYYRSQLINSVVPGGIVGDVERGLRHRGGGSGRGVDGRLDGGTLGGLRVVVAERLAGQAVQLVVTVLAVSLLPSPIRTSALGRVGLVAVVLVGAALALGLALGRVRRRRAGSRWARETGTTGASVVPAFGAARVVWVVVASVVVIACHAATLIVVVRAAGADVPLPRLLPLVLLLLTASAVPLNVGGWGPREGAAAWLFGAAGLGAQLGLTVAVTFGITSLLATLPGVLTLARRSPTAARSTGTVVFDG